MIADISFGLTLYFGLCAIPQCFTQTAETSSEKDTKEKEWLEKLFGECEDEFCVTFGVYDGKYKASL